MRQIWNEDAADPAYLLVLTQKDLDELRAALEEALGKLEDHDSYTDWMVELEPIQQWLDKAEFTLQTGGVRT